REVKKRGIDLVFAVDTSRSMLAEDVVPNRLERSQIAITDFVDRLEGDRIGLIPFAGKAFSLCPLTLDYSAFRQSLDALDTEIIPHQGTDLASAVDEANRLFDEEGNSHRILILITDGEDLQGAVSSAIAAAKEKNMVIHTVGVGDPEGSLIPITRRDGSQDFVRDESGQPVRTALDETTLREISESTGGIYVPMGQSGQGLNQIYREKLRLVPKTEMDQRLDRIPLERFEWPLSIATFLLLIEYIMNERRRKTSTKEFPLFGGARKAFSKVKAGRIAAILVFFMIGNTFALEAESQDPREIYNSGTSAYKAGDFEKAEQILSQSLDSAIDLPLQQRGYYNLGNTRYRLGQSALQSSPEETIKKWEASVKAFDDALALDSSDEDAAYNRDFVKKKLEELKQQQQQDQQQQDQQQQDQQQQDQQQQDQQQQDQQQQDQQQQDQQQQDQQQQDQQQQDQQQQDQQQQDQQQQDQQQ
ncbi:MAG: VWA domain-containing protein, partial [Verrucomicrobiales bacterium]|nr:VWA domain-containing protein [Verrucomicrobiales bacterium]